MILIITNTTDLSACSVSDWLTYYNQPFVSITNKDKVEFLNLNEDLEFQLMINDTILLDSGRIKSVWYRRGAINLSYPIKPQPKNNLMGLMNTLANEEQKTLEFFLYEKLFYKNSLGNKLKCDVNKLFVNLLAKKNGLLIPKSLVVTNTEELKKKCLNKEQITKTILQGLVGETKNKFVSGYTELVDFKMLKDLPSKISPSYIQEKINKKFEIRSFFIEDEFYSMAIFSQKNNKTKLDFRHYDDESPNRTVPFKLPTNIKTKLIKTMHQLGLNTGSIDLIYSEDKKYYFLEVNPVGQYGMVSYPCNYYLDDTIAKFLLK
jgi:ATP-GRASP peptide maturase of grasp-with-spasm system